MIRLRFGAVATVCNLAPIVETKDLRATHRRLKDTFVDAAEIVDRGLMLP
jgi:hypothetical protein